MSDSDIALPPSRAVSVAVSAALVALWGGLRLAVFETSVLPLTYALPLLVCIWSRDRTALWGMAAVFGGFHTVKMFWLMDPLLFSQAERWTNYGATLVNISATGAAVHLAILLRERLEISLANVKAQAEELRAQQEELAQQNEELAEQGEELAQQTEVLAQQGEELASQNEELQSQSEEIARLMEVVERRSALLQTLMETTRSSGSEDSALGQIAAAGLDLFRDVGVATAIYEQTAAGLCLRARAPSDGAGADDDLSFSGDDLVRLALEQGRTAALADARDRPDLQLACLPGQPPFRAVLAAPIRFAGRSFGALAIYGAGEHEWSDEDFSLADWLADQSARVLQALRLQSDLREADARKSVFLATLSHELRNPLAAIRYALEVLDGRDAGDDAAALPIMRRQLGHLVRLTDDLLDATRLSSNKIQIRRKRIDFAPILQHAIQASQAELSAARHEIDVALPDTPVWVDADPDRLAQVVTNLLSNATRYTPPGGRIQAKLSLADGETVLSVIDSGVGLEAQDLERVFEMFLQVGGPGSGGLGIGLALVRGIVELHGGRVEALSDGPGRGSEFRIWLPIARKASERETAGVERRARAARSPRRVMIVDDNVDSAGALGALFEMRGHLVHVAHDAESALAAAADFAPDAGVLDIGLPGADGYELARRLRRAERTRRMRLVALTGWGQDADRALAEAAGFDMHLTKPAEPERILAAIEADGPSAGEPAPPDAEGRE